MNITEPQILIQVVPYFGPEPNAVVDGALTLACALRNEGIESVFISATPFAADTVGQGGWRIVSLRRRHAQSLTETLLSLAAETKAVGVLLHFSGYGYQKRGVPLWLTRGLRNWRARSHVPLITRFHELYATGRFWQSSFWLSPVQKLIARDLLDISSEAISTTEICGAELRIWNSGPRVISMPVFSNVGEPGCGLPPADRVNSAVTLGLAGTEERLFGAYRPNIERVIAIMGIERIIDVGPRFLSPPTSLAGVPVIPKGHLPSLAVSELMQQARFGLVRYPLDVVAKSGVFAAYAAHGLVPIVFPDRGGSFDGLEAGRHFLDGIQMDTAINTKNLAAIQRQLFEWYASHSSQAQARFLHRSINGNAAVTSRAF